MSKKFGVYQKPDYHPDNLEKKVAFNHINFYSRVLIFSWELPILDVKMRQEKGSDRAPKMVSKTQEEQHFRLSCGMKLWLHVEILPQYL